MPGSYVWDGTRYLWKAGYWAGVQPGYVWVEAHYRWTPSGYVFIPGYWDLAVSRRGILYAPVYINPGVVRVGFVYTPAYAVRDTVVLDSLWVRPCYCHYYFGDYYNAGYRDYGFESCVVYSQRRYDSIFVYERWDRRADPRWYDTQLVIYKDRVAGLRPLPPRTLTAQINIGVGNVYVGVVLAPAAHIAREHGVAVVRLTPEHRQEALRHAVAMREVAAQRTRMEVAGRPGEIGPRTHTFDVPKPHPAGAPAVATRPAATTPPPGRSNVAPATHPTTPTTPARPGTAPPPGHPGTVPPGTHPPGTPPPGGWPHPGTPPPQPGHNPPPKDDRDKKPQPPM